MNNATNTIMPFLGIIGALLGTTLGFFLSWYKDVWFERRKIKVKLNNLSIEPVMSGGGKILFNFRIQFVIENLSVIKQPIWDLFLIWGEEESIKLSPQYHSGEKSKTFRSELLDPKTSNLFNGNWNIGIPIPIKDDLGTIEQLKRRKMFITYKFGKQLIREEIKYNFINKIFPIREITTESY